MTDVPVPLEGARVLLVDDTPENLKVLREMLEVEGYNILVATSGDQAITIAHGRTPDLILMDVMMPGLDGFETCRRLKQSDATRSIPVIFVTARSEPDAVIEGFESGGVDYVVKPFNDLEVLARVRTHLERETLGRELAARNRELTEANDKLREEMEARERLSIERNRLADRLSLVSSQEVRRWGIEGFVGRSQTMREIIESVGRVQTVETTVLITGESGTGKELIARAIHFGGPRAGEAFVPLNCSAIPSELVEATLFGHTRGAFTGADRDRPGCFRLADGGTLFLDEIAEMPVELQAKLLRVLEDGEVTPVGASSPEKVRVRVLAATNADLPERIASGAFRQDLYYRLARFTVSVPPLRERAEDIPLLVEHFVDLFAHEMGIPSVGVSEAALERIRRYDFPGNVRELRNVVERALIESGGKEIRPEHLHWVNAPRAQAPRAEARDGASPMTEGTMNLKEAEASLIDRVLAKTNGNIAEAARILGTSRPKIYKHLEDRRQAES